MPRKYRARATEVVHYEVDVFIPDHVHPLDVETWIQNGVQDKLNAIKRDPLVALREEIDVYHYTEVKDEPKV